MATRAFHALSRILLALLLWVPGCGNPPPAKTSPITPGTATSAQPVPTLPEGKSDHGQVAIPVTTDDLVVGPWNAPVTLVAFFDLQCPFCNRVSPSLKQAQTQFGSSLRLVFKHNPLPFHNLAYEAALASVTVRALAGNDAGFKFLNQVLEGQRELSEENLQRWAVETGVAAVVYREAMDSRRFARKVDADLALAAKLGAKGTPAFRINGVTLSGAQPYEEFAKIIEAQLAAAKVLLGAGTPPSELYGKLTAQNLELPPPTPVAAKPDEDPTVWKIPVYADDPQLGPVTAPITLIVFSDFECPFCQRSEATLQKLREQYGDRLRIVWKDNPLPMHEVAPYAASLGRLVYQRKGNAAFWQLHDALFQDQEHLLSQAQAQAAHYGLSRAEVAAALDNGKVRAKLEQSQDLASEYQVRGAPHFFINGLRLSGAQPLERFVERIELAQAKVNQLLDQDVPPAKLYETLQKDAQAAAPPERRQVPLPSGNRPSRGNPSAPVTLQVFSDFQCPFCKRMGPTLSALEKEFPGKIRILWRHLPLPFHDNARLAAVATEAAYAQKGNQGFWAYHDRLFAIQDSEGGLGRENLERIAGELGLDADKFKQALDEGTYLKVIEADEQVGRDANIQGTPATVINGYFLSGAQPLAAFRRVVRFALAESKQRKTVQPQQP